MKLYLLRHGSAEERHEGKSDRERKLTQEGIAEMEGVARGISRLVGELDLILSSPLVRALETAKIVAAEIRVLGGPVQVSNNLASGAFDWRSLHKLLAEMPSEHRVMLVGHEPDFSEMVRELTGGVVEMRKAGLAYIDLYRLEPGGGVLRWLLTPRHMLLSDEQSS